MGTVGFANVSPANFGIISWSDTQIVILVPMTVQAGAVYVVNQSGAVSNSVNLTVLYPTITSVSPNPIVTGEYLTINGTNFGTTPGEVVFPNFTDQGTAIASWTNTQIVAMAWATIVSGPVHLQDMWGLVISNSVNLTVLNPTITNISPTTVVAGQPLTITGTNFGPNAGAVVFPGWTVQSQTSFITWTNTQIVFIVPSEAQSGNVYMEDYPGWAWSNSVYVTVIPPPEISSISPTSGPPSTVVTISGQGFGNTQGSSTVTFGGALGSPTAWSNTSVTVPVPSGASSGNVIITVGGAASNGVNFTVPVPSFTPTGSLTVGRWLPTVTQLNNGKVLVAGGFDRNSNGIADAELYDSGTGTFDPTGNLTTPRGCATATLLDDGDVLVAGGYDADGDLLDSAEIYNPAAGSFTALAIHLAAARACHTASLLSNGKVLIVGGFDRFGSPLSSAELFDPVSGVTVPLQACLHQGRAIPTATILNNGEVLIAGGVDGKGHGFGSAELFDPHTDQFIFVSTMGQSHGWGTATLLNSGMVLIAGGLDPHGAVVSGAELFDPATETFTPTGSLITGRALHTATLLNNGKVLIAGGLDSSEGALQKTELYDQASGTFTSEVPMIDARLGAGAVRLVDGDVLVVAGYDCGALTSAELYQPIYFTPEGLVSVSISPTNPSIEVNTDQQLTATGTFSDNTTESLQSVAWTSSSPSVATISNDSGNFGNIFGIDQGTTTISACAGSLCGYGQATVTPETSMTPAYAYNYAYKNMGIPAIKPSFLLWSPRCCR